ncbi:putative leucine-rich repeat domain superfamily [Helianthus annuus]|nr:putative leucine-rich repeat domain superfamily [Helianthus annuus]
MLGEFIGLQTLDLSCNQLTKNVPCTVGNLPALTKVVPRGYTPAIITILMFVTNVSWFQI